MHKYGFWISFVLLLLTSVGGGCGKSERAVTTTPGTQAQSVSAVDSQNSARDKQAAEELAFVNRVRPTVETFCGDCHVMPRPSSTAKEDWVDEVNQGFVLYGTSGRSDLEVPPYDEVLKFFQYQAPDHVALPTESFVGYRPTPVSLRASGVRLPSQRPPGITNVRWIDIGLKDSPALVYCDIGTGAIKAHWPLAKDRPTERLATLLQPVHVEPCDLDGDGLIDLVAADIGEFNAEDSDLGRVVWLRRKADSEKFEKIVLQEDLSRVADVQPGDFDGDGDLDLIVAVFGWRATGQIILLENKGGDDGEGKLKFTPREIDPRHGAVHVPPVDFNGDGHLDFITLISQDHEVVEVFINDGKGSFSNEVIWSAPDPAYGSSGIQLVDMDIDGDLDVLYTNGDSFDRGPKPFHSVQWLENEGTMPFKHHHLAHMPGVLTAKAGDFDGDGDLDVVAAALLAASEQSQFKGLDTSSVVMLMQTDPGVFEPTMVEPHTHDHISLDTGDFNDDGKLDFAVGTFLRDGGLDRPDLVIWWNES